MDLKQAAWSREIQREIWTGKSVDVCVRYLPFCGERLMQGKDTGGKAERLLDCWLGTDRPRQVAKLRGCKLAV